MVLDNTGTSNVANRLGTAVPIRLNGGTFDYKVKAGVTTTDNGFGTLNIGSSSVAGKSTVKIEGVGPATNTITFANLAFAAGNTLNFNGTLSGRHSAQIAILFTGAPALTPATTGIIARATVTNAAGTSFDFATYNTTDGLIAFTGYTSNFDGGAPGDVVKLTAGANLTASRTLTALALSGSSIAVTGNSGTALTLSSGGVLVTGNGNDRLTVPILAFGGVEGVFHINAGSTLTLGDATLNAPFMQNGGSITGTAGLSVSDGGNLVLQSAQYYTGGTYLNEGGLKLAQGAVNTLLVNQRLSVTDGMLDLNGGVQSVGDLTSASTVTGGTITNTGGAPAILLTNTTNTVALTFAGSIQGSGANAVTFVKAGTQSLSLTSINSYGGATIITGGTLSLVDHGELSATSGITIRDATLSISNGGQVNDFDRVNNAAPISLSAGGLALIGRQQVNSTETVGTVTIGAGASTITVTTNGVVSPGTTSTTLDLVRSREGQRERFGHQFCGHEPGPAWQRFTNPHPRQGLAGFSRPVGDRQRHGLRGLQCPDGDRRAQPGRLCGLRCDYGGRRHHRAEHQDNGPDRGRFGHHPFEQPRPGGGDHG